jgi:uncharacterized OB-fold protein
MSEVSKPLPGASPDTRPFWDGCRAGQLLYQNCRSCGRVQFYPRTRCVGCSQPTLEWRRSAGAGTVHAVTVVYRAPSAAFQPDVPYAIALVDLDEGFRMMANVIGCDPETVAIGDQVRLIFEHRGEVSLPQFTPTGEAGQTESPRPLG